MRVTGARDVVIVGANDVGTSDGDGDGVESEGVEDGWSVSTGYDDGLWVGVGDRIAS